MLFFVSKVCLFIKSVFQCDCEGKGEKRSNDITGDVVLNIKQIPNQQFERKGNDLLYRHNITLKEALTGVPPFTITTLDRRKLKIVLNNEIINPDFVHIVNGEGMPVYQKENERGNLIIKFDIKFPEKLQEYQKKTIAKILDNNYKNDTSILTHVISGPLRRVRNIIK